MDINTIQAASFFTLAVIVYTASYLRSPQSPVRRTRRLRETLTTDEEDIAIGLPSHSKIVIRSDMPVLIELPMQA
jgi:cell division protein FtsW (lipid II flippase)